MSLIATFFTALMLSIGHCIGMCGGFVLAYNLKLKNKSFFYSFNAILIYQISRIFTYSVLGAIFGAFGAIFMFNHTAKGFLFFFIGIFMVILGIALITRGKLLEIFEKSKIWDKFGTKIFQKASNSKFSGVLLGVLNGLFPCGIVYTFLAAAMMSKSAIDGALILFVFGLGSLPMMIFFANGANFLSVKFKKIMLIISSILIIAYGIYHSFLGYLEILK